MKYKVLLSILVLFLIVTKSYSQIGNESGKYDSLINQGYSIIKYIGEGKTKLILNMFKETDFQSKDDFKGFLKKENTNWLKHTVSVFGITPKSDIDISEWRVKTEQKSTTSVTLTYYFKKANAPFSNINDHISCNFIVDGDQIILNGLMIFKKDDYLTVKNILENIPQN